MTKQLKYLVNPLQRAFEKQGSTMVVNVDIVSDSADTYGSIIYPNGCQTTNLSNVVIDYNHNMFQSGASMVSKSVITTGRDREVLSAIIEIPDTAVLRDNKGNTIGNMQQALESNQLMAVSVSFTTFAYQVSDNYAINHTDKSKITEAEYNILPKFEQANWTVHYVKWDMIALAFLDVPPGQNNGSGINSISYRSFGQIEQTNNLMKRTYLYVGDLYTDSADNAYICTNSVQSIEDDSSTYVLKNILTNTETTIVGQETETFESMSTGEFLVFILEQIKNDTLKDPVETIRTITKYQKNRCFCLEYLNPQKFYSSPSNDLVQVLEATETEVKVLDLLTGVERTITKPETEDLTSEWDTYKALDMSQLYMITVDEDEVATDDFTDPTIRSLVANIRACAKCDAVKQAYMTAKTKKAKALPVVAPTPKRAIDPESETKPVEPDYSQILNAIETKMGELETKLIAQLTTTEIDYTPSLTEISGKIDSNMVEITKQMQSLQDQLAKLFKQEADEMKAELTVARTIQEQNQRKFESSINNLQTRSIIAETQESNFSDLLLKSVKKQQ